MYSNRTYMYDWHALGKLIITLSILVGIQQSNDLTARRSPQLPSPTIAEEIRRFSAEICRGEFERRQNKSSQQPWACIFPLWNRLNRQNLHQTSANEALRSLENIWWWSDSLEGNDNCLNLVDEKGRFCKRSMVTIALPVIASRSVMAHRLPLPKSFPTRSWLLKLTKGKLSYDRKLWDFGQ